MGVSKKRTIGKKRQGKNDGERTMGKEQWGKNDGEARTMERQERWEGMNDGEARTMERETNGRRRLKGLHERTKFVRITGRHIHL